MYVKWVGMVEGSSVNKLNVILLFERAKKGERKKTFYLKQFVCHKNEHSFPFFPFCCTSSADTFHPRRTMPPRLRIYNILKSIEMLLHDWAARCLRSSKQKATQASYEYPPMAKWHSSFVVCDCRHKFPFQAEALRITAALHLISLPSVALCVSDEWSEGFAKMRGKYQIFTYTRHVMQFGSRPFVPRRCSLCKYRFHLCADPCSRWHNLMKRISPRLRINTKHNTRIMTRSLNKVVKAYFEWKANKEHYVIVTQCWWRAGIKLRRFGFWRNLQQRLMDTRTCWLFDKIYASR